MNARNDRSSGLFQVQWSSCARLRVPRCRPCLEVLEDRLVPTGGLFIENFSSDYNLAAVGYDSWDADPQTIPGGDADNDPATILGPDDFEIPHQVTSRVVLTTDDLGRGNTTPHMLLPGGSTPQSYYISFLSTRGQPGGLSPDNEVTAVSFSTRGLGRVVINGDLGTKTFLIDNLFAWNTFTATSNDPSDSGREVGAIRDVWFTPTEFLMVDDVTVLVFESGFSNHPPAAGPDLVRALPGQTVRFNPLDNDADVDGDPITLIHWTPPIHGTLDFDRPEFRYTPEAGFHGEESMEYLITDGRIPNFVTGTVHFIVNTPPAGNPHEYRLSHGLAGPFAVDAFSGLLTDVSDADGDVLTLRLLERPSYGDVTILPDGSFTYVPTTPDHRARTDFFTYEINDGFEESGPIPVNLHLENALPEAHGGEIAADHGAVAPLHASFAAVDRDGDLLTASIVEAPTHGFVSIQVVNGQTEIQYTPNYAGGRVLGSDRFTYRLFDGYEYGNSTSVEIQVPNHPPIAIADHFEVDEHRSNAGERFWGGVIYGPEEVYGLQPPFMPNISELSSLSETKPGSLFISQLTPRTLDTINDYDPDGDRLTFEVVSPPRFGALTSFDTRSGYFFYRSSAHSFPQLNPVTGEVRTDVGPIPTGFDWFEYRVSDGYDSRVTKVIIDYMAEGRNPAIQNFAFDVLADRFLFVAAEGLERPPGAFLHLRNGPYLVENPIHGHLEYVNADGSFKYIPDPGYVGGDSFRYLLSGNSGTRTVRTAVADIIVVNSAPEPQPDQYYVVAGDVLNVDSSISLLANDTDFNHHTLTVHSIGTPAHGQFDFTSQGTFIYRPDPGFVGTETLPYTVSDGYDVRSSTVTITVLDSATQGDAVNVMTPQGKRVVLFSSPGTTLENVSVTATPPEPPPLGLTFPLGFFHFEVHGLSLGGLATVRFLLPAGAPAVNEYWKYDPNLAASDRWYPYRFPFAEFLPGEIRLHFQDGVFGDSTGRDGVVVDPGGPAARLNPQVERVVINNGDAQRSRFFKVQIYFTDLVTLDRNAFELYRGTKRFPLASFFTTVVDGKTMATLQFSAKSLPHLSLPEGQFRLVTRGRAVNGRGGGQMLTDQVDSFFRLYGDVNGDGVVDATDRVAFAAAYGTRPGQAGYLAFLDSDGNGRIDAKDRSVFDERLRRRR